MTRSWLVSRPELLQVEPSCHSPSITHNIPSFTLFFLKAGVMKALHTGVGFYQTGNATLTLSGDRYFILLFHVHESLSGGSSLVFSLQRMCDCTDRNSPLKMKGLSRSWNFLEVAISTLLDPAALSRGCTHELRVPTILIFHLVPSTLLFRVHQR